MLFRSSAAIIDFGSETLLLVRSVWRGEELFKPAGSDHDFVILAGKGHETYQVLKDRTIAFDDREVARQLLRSFGYRK